MGKMKILFMGNNYVGYRILKWLVERNEKIVGLIVHPDERATYKKEILVEAAKTACPIWEADTMKNPAFIQQLQILEPDLILSIIFGYILDDKILQIPSSGAINLHNGYLPYCRGVNANIWSIIEDTPAGATLHYMDKGIDTGDILRRKEVPLLFSDTGKTLYRKIEQACIHLFEESWDQIKNGEINALQWDKGEGSFHRSSDLKKIECIELEKSYTGMEIVSILRALTFSPYKNAYILHNDKRYYIDISIKEDDNQK